MLEFIDLCAPVMFLFGVIIGAIVILLSPLLLGIPHYAWATVKNLYIDFQHFGLIGTFKYRAKF